MDIYERIITAVIQSAADQGISVEELAAAIGMSESRRHDVVSGREGVTRAELVRACEFLELDIADAGSVPEGPGTLS